jgi:hypothetical protein
MQTVHHLPPKTDRKNSGSPDQDPDFKELVTELCDGAGINRAEVEKRDLSYFFMAVIERGKRFSLARVAVDRILKSKVNDWPHDSAIYGVCVELAKRAGVCDAFDDKSVLTLIKRCYRTGCPKPAPRRKMKKYQIAYQEKTRLIQKRRENGSL